MALVSTCFGAIDTRLSTHLANKSVEYLRKIIHVKVSDQVEVSGQAPSKHSFLLKDVWFSHDDETSKLFVFDIDCTKNTKAVVVTMDAKILSTPPTTQTVPLRWELYPDANLQNRGSIGARIGHGSSKHTLLPNWSWRLCLRTTSPRSCAAFSSDVEVTFGCELRLF